MNRPHPAPYRDAAPREGVAADLAALAKLPLVAMVMLTVAVGYLLGHPGTGAAAGWARLAHTLAGSFLAACGAMILNQVFERSADARMRRTLGRPLPAGRIGVPEAVFIGTCSAACGLAWMSLAVGPLAATVAAATAAVYLLIYTPMKTRTSLCTVVGAVSGALPPLIGFAASAGALPARAWTLFAVLFAWQVPHFLAVAWLHREDYARAGQVMLPVVDPSGHASARQAVWYTLALLAASLMPTVIGMCGPAYFAAAVLLGWTLVLAALGLVVRPGDAAARRLFITGLIYLPLLLAVMVADRR